MNVVLFETLLLPPADSPSGADGGPSIRVEPLDHEVRFRRRLEESPGTRTWWLDVAVSVALVDPEQVLRDCEGFVVDSTDDHPVGMVEAVETDEVTGYVSALEVTAEWSWRRRFRIPAEAIELVIPADERIVVRVPPEVPPEAERPLS